MQTQSIRILACAAVAVVVAAAWPSAASAQRIVKEKVATPAVASLDHGLALRIHHLEGELDDLEDDLAHALNDAARASARLTGAQTRLEVVTLQLPFAQHRLAIARAEHVQAQARVEAARPAYEARRRVIDQHEADLAAFVEAQRAAFARTPAMTEAQATLAAAVAAYERTQAHLKAEIESSYDYVALNDKLESIKARLVDLRRRGSAARAELIEATQQMMRIDSQLNRLRLGEIDEAEGLTNAGAARDVARRRVNELWAEFERKLHASAEYLGLKVALDVSREAAADEAQRFAAVARLASAAHRELSAAQSEMGSLQSALRTLPNETADAQGDLERALAEAESIRREIRDVRREIDHLRARRARIAAEKE